MVWHMWIVDLKKEVNNNARELNRNVEHTPDIVLLIIFCSSTSFLLIYSPLPSAFTLSLSRSLALISLITSRSISV